MKQTVKNTATDAVKDTLKGMAKNNGSGKLPELNGLSIDSLSVSQDGELRVVFDLPIDQTTYAYQRELQGVRSLDVYEHPRIKKLCRDLFRAVREVALKPDPEMVDVDCDACKTSDCCRKYNVLVHDSDLDRLSEGLGVSKEQLRERFLTRAVDWCEDYKWQLVCDEDDDGEKCMFLLPDDQGRMRCSIYEYRPQICRDFDMRTCTDFVPLEEVETL